jgi:hypothetical protein
MTDTDTDSESESPTPHDGQQSHRLRYLLVALVLIVLALSFGKAIANGYYFGGCDEAARTRHFITHVLGFKMCRDQNIETQAATETTPAGSSETATNVATTPPPNNEGPAAHDYASPCQLYVNNHNAELEITGSAAATDCERFVNAAGQTPWTTEAQTTTETRGVICEVTNHSNEHATVTDTGGHTYGSEACKQLSGEGWG